MTIELFFSGCNLSQTMSSFWFVSFIEKRACVDIVLNIHVCACSINTMYQMCNFFVMSSFYVLISIKWIHLIFVCMFCKQIKGFFSVPKQNLWFFKNINDLFISVYILLFIWYFFKCHKNNLVDCLCHFWPSHMWRTRHMGVLLTEKLRSS